MPLDVIVESIPIACPVFTLAALEGFYLFMNGFLVVIQVSFLARFIVTNVTFVIADLLVDPFDMQWNVASMACLEVTNSALKDLVTFYLIVNSFDMCFQALHMRRAEVALAAMQILDAFMHSSFVLG